jgi:hypothetical protein
VSPRAASLSNIAERQMASLIDLLSAGDEAMLARPCAGRQKLGDGSVAACAAHFAGNYARVARFVLEESESPAAPAAPAARRRKATGRLLRVRRSFSHVRRNGPGSRGRIPGCIPGWGELDRQSLIEELQDSRRQMLILARLSDDQLDAVPPASAAMRFCDGERTMDEILVSVLRHQGHQLDAIVAAVEAG